MVEEWLDSMILETFFNLSDFMIPADFLCLHVSAVLG